MPVPLTLAREHWHRLTASCSLTRRHTYRASPRHAPLGPSGSAVSDADRLAPYLAASVREHLEARYYARINEEARIERVLLRPDAWEGLTPTFLMPDHGVVHVRDVAGQVLDVIDLSHGVLIPLRDEPRLAFMRALGVALAYLHDIGMVDASPRGRLDHATVAAHALFTRAFDPLVATVWREDRGGVASRLSALVAAGAATGPGQRLLREILALSLAHSKRAVPIDVLNDPAMLRRTMLDRLAAPPPTPDGDATMASSRLTSHDLARHYEAFDEEAFAWLIAGGTATNDLRADVIDTLRALRCADALRQRGLVHKTSGGYEAFVSQESGRAVHALRRSDEELYLLEWDNEHSAGEANIAASSLTPGGDLRIAFHVGSFGSAPALDRAVAAAALVVHDIIGDAVASFQRPTTGPLSVLEGMPTVRQARIQLESVDDALEFALRVRDRLALIHPGSLGRIDIVASLEGSSSIESGRYLAATPFAEGGVETEALLRRLAASGVDTERLDTVAAFGDVRIVTLERNELLVRAGTAASFVYVPLDDGFEVRPLGGYRSFAARAFIPLGSTGVIRGASRNADVVAEARARALVIPRSTYLTHWYRPYSLPELRQRLMGEPTGG
jgi:hypothetical protein